MNPTTPTTAPAQAAAASILGGTPAPAKPATPPPGQGSPATPPAEKKKQVRLSMPNLLKVADWLKQGKAKPFIDAGISPGGIARAAGKMLGFEVPVTAMVNVAAGTETAFPEVSQGDRLKKLEDAMIANLTAHTCQVVTPKAA